MQSNMVKQLTKLVKVRFVEDLTSKQRQGESPHPVTATWFHQPGSRLLIPFKHGKLHRVLQIVS